MWSLSFSERIRLRISLSWKFFLAILLPFVLLPLIFIHDDDIDDEAEESGRRTLTKFKTLYVIIIMAVYWALEIIPLPVTALIPLVLFPTLGVQTAYTVSENYSKESNMIFLGGVIIALGIEYCGLHNRIALKVMNIVGSSPIQLLFGVMSIVALLSMWVSATSCVAVLVPVVCAIIHEIHESPEILTKDEVRRMSIAAGGGGSLGEDSQNPRIGSLVPDINAIADNPHHSHLFQGKRDSSSTTGGGGSAALRGRRNTSVFGNLGLGSSYHKESNENLYPPSLDNLDGHLGRRNNGPSSVTFSDANSNRRGSNNNIDIIVEDPEGNTNNPETTKDDLRDKLEKEKENKRNEIKKMFLFGMAYAANIGGTAVITGTSPNKVFKEVIKPFKIGEYGHRNMTFFTWMALNVPAVVINIIIAWLYLSITYYGIPNRTNWPFLRKLYCGKKRSAKPGSEDDDDLYLWRSREVSSFLRREYQKLGRITFHEVSVLIIFLLVVILWIFREPDVIEGWGEHTPKIKTGDSTGAMLGVVLLFIFPKNLSFLFGRDKDKCKYEALLDWKFVTLKMPWGVLLLLGSGFAIADATLYSGLSNWIGEELLLLNEIPNSLLLLIVVILTSILTEVVSNVACANILLPVIVSVSRSLEIHPLYLTVAVALTCQYAFLFPIATPSNTIVFAAGNFTTYEMVKTGIFLNIICVAVLYVNTITYGDWLFRYSEYNYTKEEGQALFG